MKLLRLVHGSTDRRGFTLVELMIVVLVIGTVVGVALPNLNRALLRARAVDAAADLNAVRVAILEYQAEESAWPADVERGVTPAGLGAYLPGGFSFTRNDYVLDYDNWAGTVGLVGVTAVTDDRDLGLMLLDLLGENNSWTNGADKFTYVLEWTE